METKEKRWIYLLKDPRDKSNKYVGMSKNPNKRLKEHISDCKRETTKKGHWIKKLCKLGLLPILEILKETNIDEWSYWETFYIKQFTDNGSVLLNYDKNGLGTSNGLNKKTINKLREYNTIKIIQYDLSGIKVNEFKSLREAERKTGINHGNISKCCNGVFKHTGGFIFKNDNYNGVIEQVNNPNGIKKTIIETDVDGNEIAEYKSISEASKLIKIDAGNISKVCNGIRKKTNNRYFKFK